MAFTNSVAQSMPGFGSASLYGYVANTAAAAATTNLAIPAAAHPAPTGFSVAAGTPGSATAVFAAIAIYADGSIGPPVYFTLTTANSGASTYTPTITAPSDAVTGTTKYELWYVGSVGATQGTLYLGPAVIGSFSGTASGSQTIGTPGTTTFTSPFSAFNPNGNPAPSRGKFRIRTSSVGSTGTTTVLVTATDGTTTLEIGFVPTTAAGQAIDITQEFNTDLSITSITAAVTMAVASQTSFAEFEASLV